MELSFTLLTSEKQVLARLLTSDLLSLKNAAAPPHICLHLHCTSSATKGECTWKTASFLIHFWLTPEEKKEMSAHVQPFRYYETLRSLPTLSELYWEVMMNMLNPHDKTLTVKWTVLLQKASFPNGEKISGATHFYMRRLISEQVGIIDLAPFSLHCQRLEKVASEHLVCVYIWSILALVIRETATCFRVRRQ